MERCVRTPEQLKELVESGHAREVVDTFHSLLHELRFLSVTKPEIETLIHQYYSAQSYQKLDFTRREGMEAFVFAWLYDGID